MATATRADRWKMQNSKMGSRNIKTNRCMRKTAADTASMTVAVVCHDASSWGAPLDKVSQEIDGGPSIKVVQACLDLRR